MLKSFSCLVVLITMFISMNLFAQNSSQFDEHKIRVKLTKESSVLMRQALKSKSYKTSSTGLSALDQLNQTKKLTNIKPVFTEEKQKFKTRHEKYGLDLWFEITVESEITEELIADLTKNKDIQFAEPIYKKRLIGGDIAPTLVTNDPRLEEQWHYENTGQTGGTSDADIDLLQAWNIQTGDSNVVVAIIDGGVDITHEDLRESMWINEAEANGTPGVDDDGNGYVDDINGYNFGDDQGAVTGEDHGTHVGGTVAAMNNNGIGVSGVAGGDGIHKGVRLMSCQTFGAVGSDGFAEAFIYAADNGAVIAQNSWGYTSPGNVEQAVLDAIDYFIENAGKDSDGHQVGPMNGGIVIFAAGNDDSDDEWYPAYYESVLSVASTNHNDQKSWYSNYGQWVDVAAPGGETNVDEQGVLSTLPHNSYGFYQGTSMACPHVSGVAALIVSEFQGEGLTPQQVWNRITATSDEIDESNPTYAGLLGAGRVNAFRSLQTQDSIPPADIINLAITDIGKIFVTLEWTAPGASADSGIAANYDIRFSETPIDGTNFYNANPVRNNPEPLEAGVLQSFELRGLTPSTDYYFAMKTSDIWGNTSQISNVVTARTLDAPVISFSPEQLYVSLNTDEIDSAVLTISNVGNENLEFSIPDFSGASVASLARVPHIKFSEPVSKGIDNRVGYPVLLGMGSDGDEGFGYSWMDSKEQGGPVFSWTDISATGTSIYLGDDDSEQVPLPFSFNFYENSYSSVYVGSNGILSFTSNGSQEYSNSQLPNSAAPNNIIAGYWDDLNPSDGGEIFYQTVGDEFIVQYNQVIQYGDPTSYITFQVILNPSGQIKLQYSEVVGKNNSATIGIENSTGDDGMQIAFNTEYIENNLAIVISKYEIIVDAHPSSGIIAPGEQLDVQVVYFAEGLNAGNYFETLEIISNDPSKPSVRSTSLIHVNGVARISADSTLDFNQVFVTDTIIKNLGIYSSGTDSLAIYSLVCNVPDVTCNFTDTVIKNGTELSIPIKFIPTSIGTYEGTITIRSNSNNEDSVLIIPVTATAVLPPVVTYSPDSLDVVLMSGDSTTRTITIGNEQGGSVLDVEIICLEASVSFSRNKVNDLRRTELTDLESGSNTSNPIQLDGSPKTLPYAEGFESGKLDDWNLDFGSGVKEIVTNDAATGTRSFYYANTGTSSEHFHGIHQEFVQGSQPEYIGFNVKSGSNTLADAYVVFLDSNGEEVIWFLASNSGFLYANEDVGGDESYAYESLQWYSIEFKDIDWVDHDFDYYVDGELIKADIPFRNEAMVEDIASVYLYNYHASEAWFDDIAIGEPSVNWLSAGSSNVQVEPGSSVDVTIQFNAEGLVEDDYYGNINLRTNDPANKNIDIPAHLFVSGAPSISISTDSLYFECFAMAQDKKSFIIANNGTDTLIVNNISNNIPEFSLSFTDIVLAPRQQAELLITFAPQEFGVYETLLELSSNDSTDLISYIKLYGEALAPPSMLVTPESIDVSLLVGDIASRLITIDNTAGGSDLVFAVSKNYVTAAPASSKVHFESIELEKGEKDPREGSPTLNGSGADEFGYEWIDSNEPNGPAFVWNDISNIGINANLNGDDNSVLLELPFQFSFYDSVFTTVRISTNGYLTFGTDGTDYTNDQVPSLTDPNSFIAPFWDDLEASGTAYYFFNENENKFVIQYTNWSRLSNSDDLNFQVHIYANGNIEFYYEFMDNVSSSTATVGIENHEGTDGLDIAFNNEYIQSNMAIRIMPKGDYLTLDATEGIVPAGESFSIEASFSAEGLSAGEYFADIVISGNDPQNVSDTVHTRLEVIGAPNILVSVDSLWFEAFLNGSDQQTITIRNTGTESLLISNISSDISDILFSETLVTIAPMEALELVVSFVPSSVGLYEGTITIESNDVTNGTIAIAVSVEGIVPPEMITTPDSIEISLSVGSSTTQIITIENRGQTDLEWNASQDITSSINSISISSNSGTIAPGQTESIVVLLDANGLVAGDYFTNIIISGNDPLNPIDSIFTHLQVIGSPVIAISSDDVYFNCFVSGTDTESIFIANSGTDTLFITSIESSLAEFTVSATDLMLLPGQEELLSVVFDPASEGVFEGTLSIASNDSSNLVATVGLHGLAALPPSMTVTPDTMEVHLYSGYSDSRQITINNTNGGSNLAFEISTDYLQVVTNSEKVHYEDIELKKGEADMRIGSPTILGAGADEFGYTWKDSNEPNGPVYSWFDISSIGTMTDLSGDDRYVLVDLPFEFPFYGESYTEVKVSTNGYITFGIDGSDYSNDQVPSSNDPNSLIAAFWDDLEADGTNYYYFDETRNRLIIQYSHWSRLNAGDDLNFQIHLYYDGKIEFYYENMDNVTSSGATVGTENYDGSIGLDIAFNNSYIESFMAISIMPDGISSSYLTFSNTSGEVPAGESLTLDAIFNTERLIAGNYYANISVTSNDPVNSVHTIETHLEVVGTPTISVPLDSIAFNCFTNEIVLDSILVANIGTDTLIISDLILSQNTEYFTISISNAEVAPQQSVFIYVEFNPILSGLFEAELNIVSNDLVHPSSIVQLTGIALNPPVMAVSPDSIEVFLPLGNVTVQPITIQNNGDSELHWRASASPITVTSYFTISSYSGMLAAGESETIEVVFNTEALEIGDYFAEIIISGNDPLNIEDTVFTHIGVIGMPSISVNTDSLFFNCLVNGNDSDSILISNTGTDTLFVSSIVASSAEFSMAEETLMLLPGMYDFVHIAFNPETLGIYESTLTIESNDSQNGPISVYLYGEAVLPPTMIVTPDTMELRLNAGYSDSRIITIDNTQGGGNLTYSIFTEYLDIVPASEKIHHDDIELKKGEADPRIGSPTTFGVGSDEFGYTWLDSNEPNGPDFSWLDISSIGVNTNLLGDDNYVLLTLPFEFPFYGEYFTEVKVSTNGYLTFGNDGTDYSNDQVPSLSDPNSFIAPFWDDLEAVGQNYYYYDAPRNKIIVQYSNWSRLNSGDNLNFQVHLYSNGRIEFYYDNMDGLSSNYATVGTENAEGRIGLDIAFNNEYIQSNMAIRILPAGMNANYISLNSQNGVVLAGESVNVHANFNTNGLDAGHYYANIIVAGDDPLNQSHTISTHLEVVGTPTIQVSAESLFFGLDLIQMDSLYVTVQNIGSEELLLDNVSCNTEFFSIGQNHESVLSPGDSTRIVVFFNPSSVGLYQDVLNIVSNDDSHSLVTIDLTGQVYSLPSIAVNPDSLEVYLMTGTLGTRVLEIMNEGDQGLEVTLDVSYLAVSQQKQRGEHITLKKGEKDPRVGTPTLTGRGSDMRGYTWVDNSEADGPEFQWIDISSFADSCDFFIGDDDNMDVIQLPFEFPFYDSLYNQITISTNGYLTFSANGQTWDNDEIPYSVEPNNIIAPFWDDLEATGAVYFYYNENNESFIIQYSNWSVLNSNDNLNFQVHLFSNGTIEYYYESMNGVSSSGATVGIEDELGQNGLQIAFNSEYIHDSLAIRITSGASVNRYITLEQQNIYVAGNSTESVIVEFNSNGLELGDYYANINLSSNAYNYPTLAVPTHLNVFATCISDTTSMTVFICNSEGYQFGDELLTEAGTYYNYFINQRGCDSVVKLTLAMNEPIVNNTEVVVSCDSYVWNGVEYSESGQYSATFESVSGCDSIVTIDLTIALPVEYAFEAQACQEYEWNGVFYSASGVYTQHFLTEAGCDSTVALNLTVVEPEYVEIHEQSCGAYVWRGNTYTESGDYAASLTSSSGCDSTVMLHLTVTEEYNVDSIVNACGSFEFDGNVYNQSSTLVFNMQSESGCDSIITIHLTVSNEFFIDTTITTCNSSYQWHGNVYNESGVYTIEETTMAGCDSIYQLNLTINRVNTNVLTDGSSLIAEQIGAEYLWMSCEGEQLPGTLTGYQIFEPSHSGSYAVRINYNGCVDTSECYNITITSLEVLGDANVYIFPNPTSDIIHVAGSNISTIIIRDNNAKVLQTLNANASETVVDLSGFAEGIYYIEVITETGSTYSQVILE